MISESTENSYGSDYKELSVLKVLADKLKIAIVLVHHTRKCSDSDPFNMISGSTGLSGCVDGSMVLVETKRGSRNAKLHCVGRDIENAEINLHFDGDLKKWLVTDEPTAPKSKDNIFLSAVYLFIKERIHFEGTATELVEQLKYVTDEKFFTNRVIRDLVQNGYEMSKYLVSWAGCCPRNDSSAQKVKSTRISRAGSYLKPLLVQIANALLNSKEHPEFKEHYRRIKARRGHKRAIIALCRMLLTAIWNVLSKCESYSAKGYLADKTTEHSVVISKAEGLALLRQRGYIFKDEVADFA